MSEIKTVLNFFDKNNGLKAVLKDLKAIKKLQSEINKQKGGVSSDNLKERTAALKEITRLQKQLDAERKKAINTGKQAVGIEKELVKVQEQERRVQKQLKVGRTEKFRQLQESKLAQQKQTKAVKDELRETSKLSSEYERQSAKLNRLRKELKNLILTEGEGSAKTKKLALEVGQLDKRLKGADAAAGQFQRNVGNYPKGLSKAVGALKNFAGALGITAGIAGLVRALGNAITIAKDFEQGNANLAAVLGKTKDEIGTLTDDAKRLGAATAFSATQVSGLQTEFAKLGFNEQEILNATEATLSLAAATGSDLGEAAAIAGSTLGGFGLGAEETQRVVDVMAKSFSTSALDIEKFKESMKNAAPAAKAVGISVEETTALLGTLANAGISGSKAGNNLKTSFINLNKAGLTLEEGLEKVAKSEDKLGTAAKLVGKNAAASFLVLSEGVDVTKELTKGLNNAGGAAEKMAKEQLDTLQGSLTILNSAWEGFVLGLLSGDSAFSGISRSIVDFTTNLLGALTATNEIKEDTLDLISTNTDLIDNTKELSSRYIELADKTELTSDEKIELNNITNDLVETFGDSVTQINEETGALEINRAELIRQIQVRQALQSEQAKELIGEKLRLETALSGLELTRKQFKLLKEEAFGGGSFELSQLSELFRLAETDVDAFQNKVIEFTAVNQDLTATQKQAIKIISGYAIANDVQAISQERINEIQKELLRSGIDLEELISSSSRSLAKGTSGTEDNKKAKKGLTEAEKALVAAMEDELKAKKALEQQRKIDAIAEAEERNAKQENAEFNKQLSEFSKEFQQDEFDTFVEFQESGFATFKEFEEAKRKELEETEKAKEKADKEEEKRLKEQQKQKEETIKQSKELVDITIENLTMESEAKIEALDRQISAEQDFLSQNENLSAREIEFRRKKAAELELQRIEEQKRLEKLAKVQAFFDLVAAFASSGDGQGAVAKAATTMAAAEVISEGFHDGGYTGDGNEYAEAGIVHKGEFVNTKAQTTEYGMKGWKAKDFDKAVSDGYFNQFADANIFADQNAKFLSVQNNEVGYDFKNLESKLDSVINAVNNSPTTDFEINGEYFIKRTHRKGSTTTKKRKLG
jgi:hypothetical protein